MSDMEYVNMFMKLLLMRVDRRASEYVYCVGQQKAIVKRLSW